MSRRLATAAAVLLGAGLAWTAFAVVGTGDGFTEVGSLTGLRTPTDVAAFQAGWVVSDAAGEVVAFTADGAERWRVTGLRHPSGLGVRGDEVWVAEEGATRITPIRAGKIGSSLEIGIAPTDIAPAPDGRLWVSAAIAGQLIEVDGTGATVQTVDLGMRAPRALESDGSGGVWVADALDAGITHVDSTGAIVVTIGGWGASEGHFLKPKGLALLPDGSLAVADSHQGVVQILTAKGDFSRVISTADGELAFTHPLGIASQGDRLAVTDAANARVALLEPGGSAHLGGHFPAPEWLFRASPVADADPSTTCRQCHDGTRSAHLNVWDPAAKAHPLGGEQALACTSCHRLHSPDPVEDPDVIRAIAPERVQAGPVIAACASCHAAALGAARNGNDVGHPIGRLPPKGADVAGLIADGAHFEQGAIDCRTCHAPHGARYDDLLVRSVGDGALCLSCHVAQHPDRSNHPVLVKATPEAQASVAKLGGILGPKGELVCLSCHDPHGASERHLLRASGTASACRGCHSEQAQPIATGSHGQLGCAQCHGMHRGDSPAEVAGACSSCHAEEQSGPHHPRIGGARTCTGCHDPHGAASGLERTACADCHTAIGQAIAGGPHDASAHPVRGSSETCTSCHDPHGEVGAYLIAATGTGNPAVERCLGCHGGSTSAPEIDHWVHPKALLVATSLAAGERSPYFAADGRPTKVGQLGEITCRTCHQAHAPGPPDTRPDGVVRWCTQCHGDEATRRLRDFHQLAGEAP